MDEEDVGWMYVDIAGYPELCDKCERSHLAIWHTFYLRPPQMENQTGDEWEHRSSLPGFSGIKK